MYADIIISISHEKLDRVFQYEIPQHLADKIRPGVCVQVPFGAGNKLTDGYCIGLSETCDYDPAKMKAVTGIKEKGVTVEDKMIELAAWIREQYGSTMIQAIKTVVPAKKSVEKIQHKKLVRKMDPDGIKGLLYEAIRKKQTAKERLLNELLLQEEIPYAFVTGKLHIAAQTVESLRKAGAISLEITTSFRNPVDSKAMQEHRNILSPEQRQITDTVLADFDDGKPGTYLLHGITGSGKTEVYMSIIEGMLERGKQAIVLIPEIALTYQTLMRFYSRFGDRVSVMNSTLSAGEKYDQFERAKAGEIDIIIGPRSALFTPFPNLGIILVDEEHETSYKSESMPKYHAVQVAKKLASMHGASVLLGSATPSVESYYKAKAGDYRLFTLTKRLTGGSLPNVSVVDMREELRNGNRSMFSGKLQELIRDRLQKKEQMMLFLNRRGVSGLLSCRSCGEIVKCPHCDVAMSEHGGKVIVCHYCGYTAKRPPLCPKCGSKYLLGYKAGTEQVEEKIKELFPGIRTLRMDRDTIKAKDSYETILDAFANGEADVLIGTQMIVKGHDFPNVTLVAALVADMSLGSGDYRAGERTFGLLTQAVGRAGRGEKPGEALIQTYQPEHYAITYAAKQDYEGFYEEEIAYRMLGGYPPVRHLCGVQIFSREQKAGENLAKALAAMVESLRQELGSREFFVIGPAPAQIGKINDIYRNVFYLKCSSYETLIRIRDYLDKKIASMDLKNESVQFDFDPLNIM